MRSIIVSGAGLLASLGILVGGGEGADILFMSDPATNRLFDEELISHLESRGHTVDVFRTGGTTANDQIAAAESHDVVYISESVGSASLTDGLEAFIKDVATPLIIAEAFAWDDFALTGDVIHEDFGNTFRVDPLEPELQDAQDAIVIKDPSYPMAVGLSGTVQVFEDAYSVNFGHIPTMGSGVSVVATISNADDYATFFVYEKGATLEDGTSAAQRRIGFFVGQGEGDPQWDNLAENGIKLIDASFDYALESLQPALPPLWAAMPIRTMTLTSWTWSRYRSQPST